MRKVWLFVVSASFLIVVSLSPLPSMAAEAKVIKIGAVNSLTGFMAAGESLGDPGMKIAVIGSTIRAGSR